MATLDVHHRRTNFHIATGGTQQVDLIAFLHALRPQRGKNLFRLPKALAERTPFPARCGGIHVRRAGAGQVA
jgi:hypothetical protein